MSKMPKYNIDSQITEGLEFHDLARLVDRRVTVDEYKSKIGKDEEIIVLSFKVSGKNPALDLVNFIEKSYDWILDADASSGELSDGEYLVFVEMDREDTVADNLVQMFSDLTKLTDIDLEDWVVAYNRPHRVASVDADQLRKIIPLSSQDYQSLHRDQQKDIDKIKSAAGLSINTQAPKNDFTESLRIAAGIR